MSRDRLDDLFKDLPERVTVEQVAETLGLTNKAVYRYLSTQVIPGYKVGRHWLILRDEVKDAVASSRPPLDDDEGDDEQRGDQD